jgi:hypothetical protein
MNDLDLRAALHRDADLVGEPSPNLLDQLSRRRRHQRRQRAGVMAATLGVALIGAGIPVGQALLTRNDAEPAVETTVDPTPPATTERTPVVPSPDPMPSPAPSPAPETDVVEPPPVPDVVAPDCPDQATLLDVLSPAPESGAQIVTGSMPTICSGEWALAVFTRTGVEEGLQWGASYPQLFRFVGVSWTPVDRFEHCHAGEIPDDIWAPVCYAG